MSDRPAIPAETKRQILIESGHRCAVCGDASPLEIAHIIPWHTSKEHRRDDLICLCAKCHALADKDNWGQKTLREYKKRPYIVRNKMGEDISDSRAKKVKVGIDFPIALEQFDEKHQRWLKYGLAAFLDISPDHVRITAIEESNSVRVIVELPEASAEKLVTTYEQDHARLTEYLVSPAVLTLSRAEGTVEQTHPVSQTPDLFFGQREESTKISNQAAMQPPTDYRSELKEKLASSKKDIDEGNIETAIQKLKEGIRLLDERNGVDSYKLAARARMPEDEKHLALQFWSMCLVAEQARKHPDFNTMAVHGQEESVTRDIKSHEKELAHYEIINRLHLMNVCNVAYEYIRNGFVQRGMTEEARRMYYHKMVVLTKLRRVQVKYRPGIVGKIEAAFHYILLISLQVTSKFGQDPLRFIAMIIGVVALFTLAYTFLGEFSGTVLPGLDLSLWWHKLVAGFYTSLVALFALGGIQVNPADQFTYWLLLAEFAVGYFFLGLLIAMITDRLASR